MREKSGIHTDENMIDRGLIVALGIVAAGGLDEVISGPGFGGEMTEASVQISKVHGGMTPDVAFEALPDVIETIVSVIHIGQQNQERQSVGVIVVQQLVQMIVPIALGAVVDAQRLAEGPGDVRVLADIQIQLTGSASAAAQTALGLSRTS